MTRARWQVAVLAGAVVLVVAGVLAVVLTRGGGADAPAPAAEATPTATATSAGPGSEVAPSTTASPATDGGPGGGQPSSAPSQPLVPDPSAQAGSATGTLVAGYPVAVMAPVPGSKIRSSSVSPSRGRLQAALDATVRASADDVQRFYAARLAPLGFVGNPAPAVGGSLATSYQRGRSTVVVTVVTTGKGARAYTVFANLSTTKKS